jgi:argininosuccinate lyase
MSDTSTSAFEPAVARAKARAVDLARSERVSVEDALYLLRALEDLEADGFEAFANGPHDHDSFYRSVENYISARVGTSLAQALELVPYRPTEAST